MASGKTTIGKRLAKRLNKVFWDSDQEVERAAGGYNVADIYEQWGSEAFRLVERNVIQRLLSSQPPHVLSTGEGAFLDSETRSLLLDQAIVVWLKSDVHTLLSRLQRKVRPQLEEEENLEKKLESYMLERDPIYSMADICVKSNDEIYHDTVENIAVAVQNFCYPAATSL